MEHLINASIAVRELETEHYDTSDEYVRLNFVFDRGLAVGHDVEVKIPGCTAIGTVEMCWMLGEEEFEVLIMFQNEHEAFKIRMGEQSLRIVEYSKKHPELTLEQAAEKWVKENGSIFPKK